MTTPELPAAARLQIDVGDGCAPGQWTDVAHRVIDREGDPPTLAVSLDGALALPARRALLDARDHALPLDIALVRGDGALYAYTANARDPRDGEAAEAPAIVIEVLRLLAKVG